jgi:hypothetical protein
LNGGLLFDCTSVALQKLIGWLMDEVGQTNWVASGIKFLRVDLFLRRRSTTYTTFTERLFLPHCCPLYYERSQI